MPEYFASTYFSATACSIKIQIKILHSHAKGAHIYYNETQTREELTSALNYRHSVIRHQTKVASMIGTKLSKLDIPGKKLENFSLVKVTGICTIFQPLVNLVSLDIQ